MLSCAIMLLSYFGMIFSMRSEIFIPPKLETRNRHSRSPRVYQLVRTNSTPEKIDTSIENNKNSPTMSKKSSITQRYSPKLMAPRDLINLDFVDEQSNLLKDFLTTRNYEAAFELVQEINAKKVIGNNFNYCKAFQLNNVYPYALHFQNISVVRTLLNLCSVDQLLGITSKTIISTVEEKYAALFNFLYHNQAMNDLKNAIKESKYSTYLANDSMTFITEALKNDDVIFFEILYSDEILSNFDKVFYLSRLFEEHATKSLNMIIKNHPNIFFLYGKKKVMSDLKTLRKSGGIKSKEYWELSLRIHWLFLKG